MEDRARGFPTFCRCGARVSRWTSKTITNPGWLFHSCPHRDEVCLTISFNANPELLPRLSLYFWIPPHLLFFWVFQHNRYHLFKWMDESMVEEIEDMKQRLYDLERRTSTTNKDIQACESEIEPLHLKLILPTALLTVMRRRFEVREGHQRSENWTQELQEHGCLNCSSCSFLQIPHGASFCLPILVLRLRTWLCVMQSASVSRCTFI